jgi:hypothetical protein
MTLNIDIDIIEITLAYYAIITPLAIDATPLTLHYAITPY